MRSSLKRTGTAVLAAVLACGMMTGCGATKDKAVDPAQKLLTVNGSELSYGAVNFYVKTQQAQIYSFYANYYGMAGQQLFDTVFNTDGTTYGSTMKNNIIEQLEKDMLLAEHAEEYGVALTDEDKAEIARVAQATVDANADEAKATLAASVEDIQKVLELETIYGKMLDPVVADVDTNVTDEEAQQTSIKYIRVSIPETLDENSSGVESVEELEEEEADYIAPESTPSEVESVAEAVEEPETAEAKYAKAKAEEVLAAAVAAGAEADLDEVADSVDESLYSVSGYFTTNDLTDTYQDSAVVAAAAGLADGEYVDHPVYSADAGAYFVVRVEKVFDEERTETKRAEILKDRKQELFDATVSGWLENAEISIEANAWDQIKIDDKNPVSIKYVEEEVEVGTEALSEATEVESIAENVVG